MKAIDISKKIRKYKKGWVILDKTYKVIEHALTFSEINKKLDQYKNREELIVFAVSDKYFGYVTLCRNILT